ncbi:hypothetical protein ACFQZC_21790 [Streptacidiphilus monticola]
MQLVEIAPDGGATPLTALPSRCSGRYLAGERAVVVQHDDSGNERAQLSLLRLDGESRELEPLVHDPGSSTGWSTSRPGGSSTAPTAATAWTSTSSRGTSQPVRRRWSTAPEARSRSSPSRRTGAGRSPSPRPIDWP